MLFFAAHGVIIAKLSAAQPTFCIDIFGSISSRLVTISLLVFRLELSRCRYFSSVSASVSVFSPPLLLDVGRDPSSLSLLVLASK